MPVPSLAAVVGGRTAGALADGLGLTTVEDLLRHYPRRYASRGELTPLGALRRDEQVTVMAEVATVRSRPMRQRRGSMLEVVVTDGRGRLTLTFFNQSWRERDLRVGRRGLFSGRVGEFRGTRQLTHPDYLLLDADSADTQDAAGFAGALIPVYPATSATPSWVVARCVRAALVHAEDLPDPLPAGLRTARDLPDLAAALHGIHQPSSRPEADRARQRLKWDEALVIQTVLARLRARHAALPGVPRVAVAGGLLDAFDAALPYPLTAGQRRVGEEIAADLARPAPMHRLLQGEVGSGKTLVALRAMLTVVDAGGQAALLAPTEVLAAQHLRTIRALLGPLGTAGELGSDPRATRVTLVTGSTSGRRRRAALAEAAGGAAGIVVGTHALLYDEVRFAELGLVVVDEQHRFGVEQRDALRAKAGRPPHVLVMTATPIPRTVAMTVYGDLDVSALTDLPNGRRPVRSFPVPAGRSAWTDRVWARVREEVAAGHQAYVVCPRIGDGAGEDDADADPDAPEPAGDGAAGRAGPAPGGRAGPDSDSDGSAGAPAAERRPPLAVLDVAPRLQADELRGLRLAALHGRLPPEAKEEVMQAYLAGAIDVLVATTVIEVGVDVPNATAMVVLDADRFGVSQLHQIRGRVGRGSAPGWCWLVTEAEEGSHPWERVATVATTADGFALAEYDLTQRREGTILGDQQHGRTDLRLLSLVDDRDLVEQARDEAARTVAADPQLAGEPGLAAAVLAMEDAADVAYLEKA